MASSKSTVEYRDLESLGFPGYRVGDDGSVWSRWEKVYRKGVIGCRYVLGGEWLPLNLNPHGDYVTVRLHGKNHYVHRLVLEAFIGPCPPGMECRHLDGDGFNNRRENLEWNTRVVNNADKAIHGTSMLGERNQKHRDALERVRAINAGHAAAGMKRSKPPATPALSQSRDRSPVKYRDIPGSPGYRAGSDGSIWTLWQAVAPGSKVGTKRALTETWQLLKQNKWGPYMCVKVYGRTHRVHALVLLAFVGPRPDGMQGCHADRDGTNNTLANLRYGTPKANAADKLMHGTDARGEKQGAAKLTEAKVRMIRSEYADGGITQKQLARRHGVSVALICLILNRLRWAHLD